MERDLAQLPQPNDTATTMDLLVGLRRHYARRDAELAGCSHSCVAVNFFPVRGVHLDDEGHLVMPRVAPAPAPAK